MNPAYCTRGGRVVGTQWPIPTAAYDRDFGGPTLGCTHLKCSQCGTAVRNAAGLSWGATAEQLHASTDWNALADAGALERDANHRLYACACRVHVEAYDRTLIDGDDWDYDELPPPWRCAGHPHLTLPTVLDGVSLDSDDDVLTQLTSASAPCPNNPPEFTAQYPSAWMHRVLHLVKPTPPGLLTAVAAALASPDPAVRAAAANLYRKTPTFQGGHLVAQALIDAPQQWFAVPNPLAAGETLDLWAQVAVARRALWVDPLGSPLDESAREALRPVALLPHPPALSLLIALAQLDPEWLGANAAAIFTASPSHEVARDLLYALRHTGQPAIDAAVDLADKVTDVVVDYPALVGEFVPAAVAQLG
ncbi:MAG: hypothetical protein AB8H79_05935 [Myxococcota bacterium]